MQAVSGSATAVGLSKNGPPTSRGLPRTLRRLPGRASTPPGSWTSGASTGAASRPRRPRLLGIGGRLLRRAGLAHRGGRADLRRHPHLRGAHRAGARRTPSSRRRRCGSPQSRFQNGATSELDRHPGHDAAARARAPPSRSSQTGLAAGRERAEHAAGQPTGSVEALLDGPKEIPKAPAKVAVERTGRDAAAAPGHPQRRAQRRRAVRAHRRRQGGSLSELLARRHDRPARPAAPSTPSTTTSSPATACSIAIGPRINWPFFNYGRIDERRARRGRALSGVARQLPQHRAQGGPGGGGRAGRVPQRAGGHDVSSRAPSTSAAAVGGAVARAVPRRRDRLPAGARRAALAACSSRTTSPRRARRSPPT